MWLIGMSVEALQHACRPDTWQQGNYMLWNMTIIPPLESVECAATYNVHVFRNHQTLKS